VEKCGRLEFVNCKGLIPIKGRKPSKKQLAKIREKARVSDIRPSSMGPECKGGDLSEEVRNVRASS
jgi:hypothetical protein